MDNYDQMKARWGYMGLHGGHKVYLEHPVPEDYQPVRSAYALSHEHRYGGNYGPYSVAQHAVLVCETIQRMGGTRNDQLAGLHHDDSEGVLGDMPSPVKNLCPDFRKLEKLHEDKINIRYGIDVNSAIVKEADRIVFCAEVKWLIPSEHQHLYLPYGDPTYRADVQPEGEDFVYWTPDEARKTYLAMNERLSK